MGSNWPQQEGVHSLIAVSPAPQISSNQHWQGCQLMWLSLASKLRSRSLVACGPWWSLPLTDSSQVSTCLSHFDIQSDRCQHRITLCVRRTFTWLLTQIWTRPVWLLEDSCVKRWQMCCLQVHNHLQWCSGSRSSVVLACLRARPTFIWESRESIALHYRDLHWVSRSVPLWRYAKWGLTAQQTSLLSR